PDALEEVRGSVPSPSGRGQGEGELRPVPVRPHPSPLPEGEGVWLHVLVRTHAQLDAALAFEHELKPSMIYCDFEDVRRYRSAVEKCNAATVPVALATMRIVKPGEDGWLNQLLDAKPDAILVRNLAAISFFRERAPRMPLIGDYAL